MDLLLFIVSFVLIGLLLLKKKIAWACITFKSSPLGLVKQKVTVLFFSSALIRLISHPKFYILSVEENGIKSHFFF